MGAIAVFMIVTALLVLVPVVLQLRSGESRFRGAWGYFVFVLGLLLIAAGDTDWGRAHQAALTTAGIVAAVVGLMIQTRRSDAPDSRPRS